MEPQAYKDLTRHLAALRARQLQWIAEQAPTRSRLQQVLEQDRALQQVNSRALLAFCAALAARYGEANGRNA